MMMNGLRPRDIGEIEADIICFRGKNKTPLFTDNQPGGRLYLWWIPVDCLYNNTPFDQHSSLLYAPSKAIPAISRRSEKGALMDFTLLRNLALSYCAV